MEQRGMNERIRKLRALSVNTQPHIDMERAKIMTETYLRFEGVLSVPQLRAQALKDYFSQKTLYLGEGELIVGEKGDSPQGAPTFPELCCHSVEDMRLMNERELIRFQVTPEDMELQEKVMIPFWKDRCIRSHIFRQMTPEWKKAYECGIFTEFMEQRGPGHTVGSSKIYEKGLLDYQRDIQEAIDRLDFFQDPHALERKEELEGMYTACEALMILAARYSAYARELAEQESDTQRRRELLQIAANCEVVPAHRPQTYWQALQMYWFVHLAVTSELNPWDSYSPGRLDQHLFPFYERDVKAGILDDARALELLECLWIKFNNQPAPPKVGITLKESGTYTDFANINTGGITAEGKDGVNRVSYLILECMDEMKLLQPSSNVQISRKTPQKFLKRACEISRKGWGQPAFYNTEAIVQELLNAGKSLEDARRGGTSGCVETGAFGNEAYILTGYFNLPKILELTLNDGYDQVSGQQLGLKLGRAEDFADHDALFDAFKKQMKHFIDIKIRGSNVIEKIFAKRMSGEAVTKDEELKFKTAFMQFAAGEYTKLGWAMQLHYGCKRDNNGIMYRQLGPDTGYDCINNYAPTSQMTDFLNALVEKNSLPKTIIYSLNPNDDEAIGTVLGCFQNSDAVGKIQQGSAWWFNDHKTGMTKQMTSLANLGLLGNFIGMLTDSRSFLSYPRHEYFRRIMCELIGGWVENGEFPYDERVLTNIVKGISYNNAVRYFGFNLEEK